jgi:osmotically-inducible protein OsmY
MNKRLALAGGILGGVAAGAGLMYFLDPDRGRRRRAGVRQKAASAAARATGVAETLGARSRDVRNRAYGAVAEAKKRLRREPEVDDGVLEARVRARMGHEIGHPGWVDVKADHGRVTLAGRVPAAEAEALRSCVASVKGVKQVADRVEVH